MRAELGMDKGGMSRNVNGNSTRRRPATRRTCAMKEIRKDLHRVYDAC